MFIALSSMYQARWLWVQEFIEISMEGFVDLLEVSFILLACRMQQIVVLLILSFFSRRKQNAWGRSKGGDFDLKLQF